MSVLLNYLTKADFGSETGAIDEPISLEIALAHLRIDADASDSAFVKTVIIQSARQFAERRSGSAIKPARYKQTLSSFPVFGRDRVSGALSFAPFNRVGKSLPIKFTHGLVDSVDSVSYIDSAGDEQSIDVSTLDISMTNRANVELCVKAGDGWPQAADVPNAVTIVYRAGMLPDEFASTYPSVIHWMLLACGWAYENREMFLVGKGAAVEIPASYVDSLLEPICVLPRF